MPEADLKIIREGEVPREEPDRAEQGPFVPAEVKPPEAEPVGDERQEQEDLRGDGLLVEPRDGEVLGKALAEDAVCPELAQQVHVRPRPLVGEDTIQALEVRLREPAPGRWPPARAPPAPHGIGATRTRGPGGASGCPWPQYPAFTTIRNAAPYSAAILLAATTPRRPPPGTAPARTSAHSSGAACPSAIRARIGTRKTHVYFASWASANRIAPTVATRHAPGPSWLRNLQNDQTASAVIQAA